MKKKIYKIPKDGEMHEFKIEPINPVTVCNNCLCASCWKGIFMCDESDIAGITDLPIELLRKLRFEHSDYYDGTYEAKHARRQP